jgi:hypothetical protein
VLGLEGSRGAALSISLVDFEKHRERGRGVGLHANGCMHSQEALLNEVLWTLSRHISVS